ncbi:MAG: glycosyltransferase family 2 protein [Candidatus Woesearchaeota archaeon]
MSSRTEKRSGFSVVLPVHNEEKNIPILAKEYEKIEKKCPIELIFVEDGGSTDGTKSVLKKIKQTYPFIKVVSSKEKGYGISIFNGLNAASYDFICWTHADLQTDPKDTLRAFRNFTDRMEGYERQFVKGRRTGRSLSATFFTAGMSVFESLLLLAPLRDINAQPNMVHRSFLSLMEDPPQDFSFDLYCYYLAYKNRYTIKRFPVRFKKRIHGESNWNTGASAKIQFIKNTMSYSFSLKRKLRGKENADNNTQGQ